MVTVYVALGSNLGERAESINEALSFLGKSPNIDDIRVSAVYETEPVGGPAGQGKYLNAAAEFQTDMNARDLMNLLLEIEKSLGRERSVRNAPRTIDLDLLFYGDEVIDEPDLTVPHPRLQERAFVLKPLCELAPDFMHPVLKKTIKVLYEASSKGQRA